MSRLEVTHACVRDHETRKEDLLVDGMSFDANFLIIVSVIWYLCNVATARIQLICAHHMRAVAESEMVEPDLVVLRDKRM